MPFPTSPPFPAMQPVPPPQPVPTTLPGGVWRAAHQRRVDAWVKPHLTRRRAKQPHPVEDFLFT